jgi:IclR family KDG regulon transcriptional repressor
LKHCFKNAIIKLQTGGDELKEEYNYITMIDRAVGIMEAIFESHKSLGVSEISQELDLPKATVYRILITLAKGGLVTKMHGTEKYTLGGKFIKYSERVKEDINIHSVAKPYMVELANELEETVNIAIDYENAALIIERVKGEQTNLVSKLIPVAPYNCSSSGKVFLSHKSEDEINEYFDKGKAKKRTIKSVYKQEDFMQQRKSILEDGYSIDDEEYDYGLYCMGRPVFGMSGEILAVISVTGPKSRLQYRGLDMIRERLFDTVAKVEKEVKDLGITE